MIKYIFILVGLTSSWSVYAQDNYKLLEPGLWGGRESITFQYFVQNAYTIFLSLCITAAIVMIIWHGLAYMLSEAPLVKASSKGRMWTAIQGLILALTAYLLLYTINPNLVNLNLSLDEILIDNSERAVGTNQAGDFDTGEGGDTQSNPSDINNDSGPTGQLTVNNLAGPQQPGETAAEAILRNAEHAAQNNLSTDQVAGTNGGRRACVYATNTIIEGALGEGVTNSLSTREMLPALQNDSRFQTVSGGIANAQPGDIIISPTTGSQTGHVGVCRTNGCGQIISNSSSRQGVAQNYTNNSWRSDYGSLPTYIFRPR